MLFSPETIAEVKENQFAVIKDGTDPLTLKRLRRGIARIRATRPPRDRLADGGTLQSVKQYDIPIDSRRQERHLFHGPLVSWLHSFREAVQQSDINERTKEWGTYGLNGHTALIINAFGPTGEFRWHRDVSKIIGVTAIVSISGTADAYLAPASSPASSVPPRREIEPIAMEPGDVLLMDADKQPWHRVVNTTPNLGERISLAAAQIRAEML